MRPIFFSAREGGILADLKEKIFFGVSKDKVSA
jgi:hypothetical protein